MLRLHDRMLTDVATGFLYPPVTAFTFKPHFLRSDRRHLPSDVHPLNYRTSMPNTPDALWDARSASASCWGPRRHREGSTLCCPPAMVRLWIDGCLPVAVMVGEDAR